MQLPISEQIAEVKNNIRYLCKKYQWEKYETNHKSKHHRHSKSKKVFSEKNCTSENRLEDIKKSKLTDKNDRTKLSSMKSKKSPKNCLIKKDKYPRQKDECVECNLICNKALSKNKKLNNDVENQKNDSQIEKNDFKTDYKININTQNKYICDKKICLYSSDDDSDSSFDFNEYKRFFKAQNDLYHLTKHSKHKKAKSKKLRSIMLDSDSSSYDTNSDFESNDYQFKSNPEFTKRKQKINDFLEPVSTKNQETNTISIGYTSTESQTVPANKRHTQNHAKINFGSQMKNNTKQNLHSYLNSSSNSSNNFNKYSSSRSSNGSVKKQSIKDISDQYASSENESSKGSNKGKNINTNKNSGNSFSSSKSSKSSQTSIQSNGLKTIKSMKIENQMILIEEEEDIDYTSDKINKDNLVNQNLNKNANSSSYSKLSTQKEEESKDENDSIKNNQIVLSEKIQTKKEEESSNNQNNKDEQEEEEEQNYSEEELLEKISQSAKLIIKNEYELNQDEDIDKLMEDISRNSSKIIPNIKKSKNSKKKQALKNDSIEMDENTEAYSQIPSEFSDNIGVDSSLGAKQQQTNNQEQNEEVVQIVKSTKKLQLEDFMEQSGSIPISTKLENEHEDKRKNYNYYDSPSDSN